MHTQIAMLSSRRALPQKPRKEIYLNIHDRPSYNLSEAWNVLFGWWLDGSEQFILAETEAAYRDIRQHIDIQNSGFKECDYLPKSTIILAPGGWSTEMFVVQSAAKAPQGWQTGDGVVMGQPALSSARYQSPGNCRSRPTYTAPYNISRGYASWYARITLTGGWSFILRNGTRNGKKKGIASNSKLRALYSFESKFEGDTQSLYDTKSSIVVCAWLDNGLSPWVGCPRHAIIATPTNYRLQVNLHCSQETFLFCKHILSPNI